MAGPLAYLLAAVLLSGSEAPGQTPPAENAEGEEEPAGGAEEGKELTGASPTQLIPKLELRHQFLAVEGGGHVHSTTLRMDILFLRRALVRFELPRATLQKGEVQRSGFGDISLQLLSVVTSGRRQATIVLAGVKLDTATLPELGTGRHVLDLGAAAVLKPRPWWLLYGIVEHQRSLGSSDARPGVNLLLMNVGTIVLGRQRDWCLLDLAPEVDFQTDQARLLGAIELGRLLFGRVGLFVRAGTQLLGQRQVDYLVGAGVRYLFTLPPPRPASRRPVSVDRSARAESD
jgi:hypothetical protein